MTKYALKGRPAREMKLWRSSVLLFASNFTASARSIGNWAINLPILNLQGRRSGLRFFTKKGRIRFKNIAPALGTLAQGFLTSEVELGNRFFRSAGFIPCFAAGFPFLKLEFNLRTFDH